MPSYQQNKKHLFVYREKNKEKYNEYMNELMKNKYSQNPELFRKRKHDSYHFKKECERFRQMLF